MSSQEVNEVIKKVNEDKDLSPQLKHDIINMIVVKYRFEREKYPIALQSNIQLVRDKIKQYTGFEVEKYQN